jgi:hypothetical protein
MLLVPRLLVLSTLLVSFSCPAVAAPARRSIVARIQRAVDRAMIPLMMAAATAATVRTFGPEFMAERQAAQHTVTATSTEAVEPAVMPDDRGDVKWVSLDRTTLFAKKPSRGEPVQAGQLGDCGLVSTLSGEADNHPDRITAALAQNPNGSITLKGYQAVPRQPVKIAADGTLVPDGARVDPGTPKPFSVTYSATLPTQGKMTMYAASANRDVLWVPEMEKGFAVALDQHPEMEKVLRVDPTGPRSQGPGYKNLEGIDIGDVMSMLSGKQPQFFNPQQHTADEVWKALVKATAEHRVIGVGTRQEPWYEFTLGTYGIEPFHAYSVVRTEVGWFGQRYVVVRNPWNFRSSLLIWGKPEYRVRLEVFRKNFPETYVGD